ncbi:hypothetical protein Ccrd_026407 [Cynara cardunculus var. scolymus]|uniref:Uncharacterized protein n=1 Tax=Cynara cardunculus var. scolymus TaxID=59895 RepID=A0A103QB30_CYNCS|nr:hypothetical protein Ccrd_026407 [Cynara cardunculus var. scolymus]
MYASPALSTSSKPFLITTFCIQYNLIKAPTSESGSITNQLCLSLTLNYEEEQVKREDSTKEQPSQMQI